MVNVFAECQKPKAKDHARVKDQESRTQTYTCIERN